MVKKISNVGESPLFRDDGPLGARIVRRVRGITLEVIAFIVVTILLPVLLVGAVLVDLALWLRRRKPWVGVRLTAFLWWFLFGEMRALVTILGIWIITGAWFGIGSRRRRVLLYRLRVHWCTSHLSGIRVLFGLKFEIDGLEEAAPGPVMIMLRHASIIDNMLPDAIISRTHGIGLRYVIKRELQMIPTIDLGGRWVPTNFVRRASGDAKAEISRLLQLTEDLGEGEGILIYPEGTRFTPAKLERAQEIVRERQPEVSRVRRPAGAPAAAATRRPARPHRRCAGCRRRLLRPRRVRRLPVHLGHLGREAGRLGHRHQALAGPRGRDPARRGRPRRMALPQLARDGRLDRLEDQALRRRAGAIRFELMSHAPTPGRSAVFGALLSGASDSAFASRASDVSGALLSGASDSASVCRGRVGGYAAHMITPTAPTLETPAPPGPGGPGAPDPSPPTPAPDPSPLPPQPDPEPPVEPPIEPPGPVPPTPNPSPI